jgi:hypothetical protein
MEPKRQLAWVIAGTGVAVSVIVLVALMSNVGQERRNRDALQQPTFTLPNAQELPVGFIEGHEIRVGDLADEVFAKLPAQAVIRQEERSGQVTKYYHGFMVVFARPQDPGPYRVVKIVRYGR